jgi:hypothetical protein
MNDEMLMRTPAGTRSDKEAAAVVLQRVAARAASMIVVLTLVTDGEDRDVARVVDLE